MNEWKTHYCITAWSCIIQWLFCLIRYIYKAVMSFSSNPQKKRPHFRRWMVWTADLSFFLPSTLRVHLLAAQMESFFFCLLDVLHFGPMAYWFSPFPAGVHMFPSVFQYVCSLYVLWLLKLQPKPLKGQKHNHTAIIWTWFAPQCLALHQFNQDYLLDRCC